MRWALAGLIVLAVILGASSVFFYQRTVDLQSSLAVSQAEAVARRVENAKLRSTVESMTPSVTLGTLIVKFGAMRAADKGKPYAAWKYRNRPDYDGLLSAMLQQGPAGVVVARALFDPLEKEIRAVPGNGEGQFLSEIDALIANTP